MPLSYVPYQLAFASLSPPPSITGVSNHDDQPIAVPTPLHPGSTQANSLFSASIPQHHAVHANAYFPSASSNFGAGFVLARCVADATELELRWCRVCANQSESSASALSSSSFSPALDNLSPLPSPKTFLFPAPLIPNLGMFADAVSEQLHVLSVTTTGFLYRLTFALPHLFYQPPTSSDWAMEHSISYLASSDSSLFASQVFAVDPDMVLIACTDGTIIKLQYVPSAASWKESLLRPTSFLSGVSRFFSRSVVSSTDSSLSPTHTLSLESYLGATGIALAFAASRDRKLRIWNVLSDTCVRTIQLPIQADFSSATLDAHSTSLVSLNESTEKSVKDSNQLFPPNTRPLLKLFSPGQDDPNGYQLYLLVYIPAPLPSGNFFALYGIELEESRSSSGGVGQITLLWKKRCDIQTRGKTVELRDVSITPQSFHDDGWTMWTLWDCGDGPLLKYTRIGDETAANGDESVASIKLNADDVSRDDWRTVNSERLFRPLHGDDFDSILQANKDAADPADVFLARVLEPGRFSESTLRLALQTYRDAVPSTSRQPSNLFYSLSEEIGIIVGSNCQLENDPKSGAPLYDRLYTSVVREWVRFTGLAEQIENSAKWPIQLALPLIDTSAATGAVAVPMVVMRDGIALPVIEDEASIIERLQRKSLEATTASKTTTSSLLQLVTAEKTLLIDAADTSTANILAVFSSSLATVTDILTVLDSGYALASQLSASEMEAFVAAIRVMLSSTLDCSLDEAVTDIWNSHLEPLLGDEASQVIEQLISDHGSTLEAALNDIVVLLSKCTSGPISQSQLQNSSPSSSTDLGSALVADCLVQVVASRHQLASVFVLLIVALQTSSDRGSQVADLSSLIANGLAILQTLGSALELTRTEATPETPTKLGDAEDRDGIVAQLDRMCVGPSARNRTGQVSQQFAAPSLIHQCIRLNLLGVFNASEDNHDHDPISLEIVSSSLLALFSIGLTDVTAATSASQGIGPYLNDRQTTLAFSILLHGYPTSALTFLSQFTLTPASHYVQARALIQLSKLDEASTAFERVVPALETPSWLRKQDDGLFKVLPSSVFSADVQETVPLYYNHVASYFEAVRAPEYVIQFCQAAVESSSNYASGESSQENRSKDKALWFKIFRSQIQLRDYEGAYSTVMALPHDDMQKDCLRSLVGIMCESGEIGKLLRFSFPGLQLEIERILSFKARNSDPLSSPNYYFVLYSYHIFRGDLKSAGAVMYQHAERLGEIHRAGGGGTGMSGAQQATDVEDFIHLAVKQAQSYLASINALSMIKPEIAWFAHADASSSEDQQPTDSIFANQLSDGVGQKSVPNKSKNSQQLTHYIPQSMFTCGVRKIRIIGIEDIQREYALILARLELVGRYPELAFSTSTLRPADAVLLFVNSDRFDLAFSTAKSLDVDMTPIVSSLTTKAVALTQARSLRPLDPLATTRPGASMTLTDQEMEELRDGDEDFEEPEAAFLSLSEKSAGWTGSASDRAWRYLRMHLDMFDNEQTCWRYRLAVLDRSISLGSAESLPDWLETWFQANKPDLLVRTLMRYGLVDSALRQSIAMIKADTETNVPNATQAGSSWLPYSLFDELLLTAEDPDTRPSKGSASATATRSLTADLRQTLSFRIEQLEKRTQQVLRINQTDIERQNRNKQRDWKNQSIDQDQDDWVPTNPTRIH